MVNGQQVKDYVIPVDESGGAMGDPVYVTQQGHQGAHALQQDGQFRGLVVGRGCRAGFAVAHLLAAAEGRLKTSRRRAVAPSSL